MSFATQAAADELVVLDDWGVEFTIVGEADSEFTAVCEAVRGESEYTDAGLSTLKHYQLAYDESATSLRRQQVIQRTSDSAQFTVKHAAHGIADLVAGTEHLRGTR